MFNKEQFIEDIKAMTVLELADLVKALEEAPRCRIIC